MRVIIDVSDIIGFIFILLFFGFVCWLDHTHGTKKERNKEDNNGTTEETKD